MWQSSGAYGFDRSDEVTQVASGNLMQAFSQPFNCTRASVLHSMAAIQDLNEIDGQGYILDRNHLAACRLNLQHYLWKEALGFTIEPSIPIPQNANVADVACGTGLWLLDAARLLPGAQFSGFDIDLSQAPHPDLLPSSITLKEWNLFENIHPHWEGQFDLVHVRLLVLVLSGETRKSFVECLLKLLKPGGYIQWDELDCYRACVPQDQDNIH
jgi:SAM-dependent methyltransferase